MHVFIVFIVFIACMLLESNHASVVHIYMHRMLIPAYTYTQTCLQSSARTVEGSSLQSYDILTLTGSEFKFEVFDGGFRIEIGNLGNTRGHTTMVFNTCRERGSFMLSDSSEAGASKHGISGLLNIAFA